MQIGLLGYGAIGKGIYQTLKDRFQDISIKKILVRNLNNKDASLFVTDLQEILNDNDIDTVIIAIGDNKTSYDFATMSLNAKKNVVMTNKVAVVNHFSELLKLADSKGVSFKFESVAGSGLPWLRTLLEYKNLNEISEVYGTFNGTCNLILDLMKKDGIDFNEALLKTRILCYQEPDYMDDIKGVDSANKLTISIMVALGAYVEPKDIPTYGIETIRNLDFEFFERRELSPKLVSFAKITNGRLSMLVAPFLFKQGTLMANVSGNNKILGFKGDIVGEVQFIGEAAGVYPTANSVMLDVLDIKNKRCGKIAIPNEVRVDQTAIKHKFYFSFDQTSSKIERILIPYVHSIFETQDSVVITSRNIDFDTCMDLLEKIEMTGERFFFAVYAD